MKKGTPQENVRWCFNYCVIQTQHECTLRGLKKAGVTSDLESVCNVPQGRTRTKQNERIRTPNQTPETLCVGGSRPLLLVK